MYKIKSQNKISPKKFLLKEAMDLLIKEANDLIKKAKGFSCSVFNTLSKELTFRKICLSIFSILTISIVTYYTDTSCVVKYMFLVLSLVTLYYKGSTSKS